MAVPVRDREGHYVAGVNVILQGRVIAEDWQKIVWVGLDRALHSRTDGTLVRFTIPIRRDGEAGADAKFRDLAPRIVAQFPGFLPD